MITTIDALECALDGDISGRAAAKLSSSQKAGLTAEIDHFHDAWQTPHLRANEYRVSLGFFGNERQNVTALVRHRDELSGPDSSFHLDSRRGFVSALAYGDSVVAHDPTSTPGWGRTEARFTGTIEYMGRLAPLVRCGGLILAPVLMDVHRNAQRRWSRTTLHDEALEIIRDPRFDWPEDIPRDEYWEGMASMGYRMFCVDLEEIAHCEARFLPSDAFTWRYLMASLEHVQHELRGRKAELKVVPSLVEAKLPLLEGVSVSTLARLREDDEALAEWRARLRSVVRSIETTPLDRDFATEARSALADELEPAAAAIRRSMAKNRAIGRVAKEGLTHMILGGALLTGIGIIDGVGSIQGLAGVASGALTTAIVSTLFRSQPEGAALVLAKLVADFDSRS
jgi:hypothetical protein